MQKNKITIISRNEFDNADIQTQSKQFYFDDNKIHYENKLQIVENKHPKTEGINVVNNLCKIHKNKLFKTTFVYFQDKVIKIEDQFYLENFPKSVKVDSQFVQVKKPIQQKQMSNDENISSQRSMRSKKKKDLKNIVKNIVKIFMHWLQKYPKRDQCKKHMQTLLSFHKYNNSLVKAMSEIHEINEAFVCFLKTQSEDLVQSSRIHDKPTHLQVLKKYESIFNIHKCKNVVQSTSGNGSNEGNSSQNKNQSGSEDKEKFSMNEMNYEMNDVGQKMFAEPGDQMNEQNVNSKSSDSDKLFSNSDNNRNQSLMGSSNQEAYSSRDRITNRQNLIFFSSSGSD